MSSLSTNQNDCIWYEIVILSRIKYKNKQEWSVVQKPKWNKLMRLLLIFTRTGNFFRNFCAILHSRVMNSNFWKNFHNSANMWLVIHSYYPNNYYFHKKLWPSARIPHTFMSLQIHTYASYVRLIVYTFIILPNSYLLVAPWYNLFWAILTLMMSNILSRNPRLLCFYLFVCPLK